MNSEAVTMKVVKSIKNAKLIDKRPQRMVRADLKHVSEMGDVTVSLTPIHVEEFIKKFQTDKLMQKRFLKNGYLMVEWVIS